MRKYLFITHRWFMESKGFDAVEVHECASEDEAYDKACQIRGYKEEQFNHAATKYVEIEPNTRILVNRRLTLGERITGKINRSV